MASASLGKTNTLYYTLIIIIIITHFIIFKLKFTEKGMLATSKG